VTGIEPELWVEQASRAIAFYRDAFGASVLHQVGEGDDIVAQLSIDTAVFWVAPAGPAMGRFSPEAIGGGTGRILLIVDDPEAIQRRAVSAGAVETSPVSKEHGWQVGRVVDPFGHEWEIGKPTGAWPPH
jgi:PhnB protein